MIFRYSRDMQKELGLNDLPSTKSVFRHYLGPVGAWFGAFGLLILLGSVIVVFYCLLVKFLYGFIASSILVTQGGLTTRFSPYIPYTSFTHDRNTTDLLWSGWSVNTGASRTQLAQTPLGPNVQEVSSRGRGRCKGPRRQCELKQSKLLGQSVKPRVNIIMGKLSCKCELLCKHN